MHIHTHAYTHTWLSDLLSEDVLLVEFMYLVFTCMPGESYCRWLMSLMLCLCDVFWALVNSLVCWFIRFGFCTKQKNCTIMISIQDKIFSANQHPISEHIVDSTPLHKETSVLTYCFCWPGWQHPHDTEQPWPASASRYAVCPPLQAQHKQGNHQNITCSQYTYMDANWLWQWMVALHFGCSLLLWATA